MSNQKYYQIFQKINDNYLESNNRINSYFGMNGPKSIISMNEHESVPTITFQNDAMS